MVVVEREKGLEIGDVEWIVVGVVRPEMMVVEDKEGMGLNSGGCQPLSPFITLFSNGPSTRRRRMAGHD